MDKFEVKKETPKYSSFSRTIRMPGVVFDRLTELSEKNGISFNKVAVQCIEFALEHLPEEPSEKELSE